MRVTVLGCGTSSGVPQIGCDCAVCRSPDPRNHRRRCSIFIEAEGQRILVDTGPDLRQQCLDAGIGEIDALIYTHAHADHVHGIDDLRTINNLIMAPIPTYADAAVFARIRERFPYVFAGGYGGHGWWRPEIAPHPIDGPFRIGGVEVTPFPQRHGRGVTWGFRVGRFGYSTDTDGLDDAAFDILCGIEVWIVDALREAPHPSHAHLDLALSWIDRIKPRHAFLTHMNHEVDYADWAARLPADVLPAHDGLVIELAA
ncbi:MAG: MBL fold metallo-hydrolase [Geminicoccaceae bacterium]|jgi:phosphoribosyl 1,2-cyclic phosphate phosphodiesterase